MDISRSLIVTSSILGSRTSEYIRKSSKRKIDDTTMTFCGTTMSLNTSLICDKTVTENM